MKKFETLEDFLQFVDIASSFGVIHKDTREIRYRRREYDVYFDPLNTKSLKIAQISLCVDFTEKEPFVITEPQVDLILESIRFMLQKEDCLIVPEHDDYNVVYGVSNE